MGMSVSSRPLEYRFGMVGALAPFAFFLAGVLWLALNGAPDERGFWPVLLGALGLAALLVRDREAWADAVLGGMGQPIVALMVVAWLFSGVLGTLLTEGGLIPSLAWLAREAGLGAAGYTGASFLTCVVVSTATGTSFGTILVAGPLLYPAGGSLGADPVMLMGAILAGATWGDSISPVSDTTIASAGSQGTDVPGTVRSRLKYVIPAGLVALLATVVLAALRARPAGVAAAVPGSAAGIPLLVVPVIVVGMLIRRRHLLEGLLAGIGLALGLGLGLGLIDAGRVLYIDRAAFGAKGLLIDGLNRGVGVSVFTMLLMGLVGGVQASGVVDRLTARVHRATTSVRATEGWIVVMVSLAVFLTTHSVVAMLAVGTIVQRMGASVGLTAYRRANLLDLTVCTWPFLLPWFLPTILASSASAGAEALGMPRVSPLAVGMANLYAWALLLTVPLVILTGYGRGEGSSASSERSAAEGRGAV